MPGTALEVKAPQRESHSHGLLSAVEQRSTSDRWLVGVTWPSLEGSNGAFGGLDCSNPEGADGLPIDPKMGAGWVTHDDLVNVWASVGCSPFGVTEAELAARAEEKLALTTESTLEQYFWQRLGASSPVNVLTGSTFLGTALAAAEQWAYITFGCRGVIHIPRWASYGAGDDLVVDGDKFTTRLGTPVVSGVGYGMPTGSTSVPLYVTGPLVAYSSKIEGDFGAENFNHTRNDLVALRRQTWLLSHDSPNSNATVGVIQVATSSNINSATTTTTTP